MASSGTCTVSRRGGNFNAGLQWRRNEQYITHTPKQDKQADARTQAQMDPFQ